jgi:hypothetical protein
MNALMTENMLLFIQLILNQNEFTVSYYQNP